jgi:hypothetical protein
MPLFYYSLLYGRNLQTRKRLFCIVILLHEECVGQETLDNLFTIKKVDKISFKVIYFQIVIPRWKLND